jgi:hypothetical protein
MRALRIVSLAATLALLPGCVFALNTGDTLEDRIEELEKRIHDLEECGRSGVSESAREEILVDSDSPLRLPHSPTLPLRRRQADPGWWPSQWRRARGADTPGEAAMARNAAVLNWFGEWTT